MGIKEFGFSDHIPCPFRNGYVSHIRMTMEQAPDYVRTIRELADEYRNDIRIYVGFEAEYIPEFYQEQMNMVNTLGVDYLIMGQHFLDSWRRGRSVHRAVHSMRVSVRFARLRPLWNPLPL